MVEGGGGGGTAQAAVLLASKARHKMFLVVFVEARRKLGLVGSPLAWVLCLALAG